MRIADVGQRRTIRRPEGEQKRKMGGTTKAITVRQQISLFFFFYLQGYQLYIHTFLFVQLDLFFLLKEPVCLRFLGAVRAH